jgi:hypothetical protein
MAAPVVISGGRAVGVVTAPYAALREAVTDVSRALEDATWTNLSADARLTDAPYEERKALVERSRRFCRRHPLAKQATKLLINYVLGAGITLRANDKSKVARLVDEFWNSPVNQSVFTGQAAMADALKGIFSDGDLFLVLLPDENAGTMELGMIDATFVEDIVGDKDNWKVPKWYKVRKPKGHFDFNSGVWVPESGADFVWYRDWKNEDELPERPKRARKDSGNADAPYEVEPGLVYHVAINRRGLFGEPETAAAMDWLAAHKRFMENRATINEAAAQVAWRKKQKGTVASVQAEAARLRSHLSASAAAWDSNPPPSAGATVVENENSTMEWVKTDTGGAAATNDERILRMMLGAGMGGIPNHIFGDEAQANLATATAMNTPMHKSYEQWQVLTRQIVTDLISAHLANCHKAGRIGPRDDSGKYQDARSRNAPTTDGPKQLGAGSQPRQLGPGRYPGSMQEHGSKDDPNYNRYHPGDGGGTKTGGAHVRDRDDERNLTTHERYYLDDGRWDPERVTIHDRYVREGMEGAQTTDSPVVYMTGGGAAAGKTSGLLKNPGTGIPGEGMVRVNADDAKKALPEFANVDPENAAFLVHDESSHMSKRLLFESLGNGHSVVYDAVGDSGIDNLAAKVQEMRDSGAAAVYADYATVSLATALARAAKRAADPNSPDFGRVVKPSIIRAQYHDIPVTVTAAIERDVFDRLRVWSTESRPPVLLATYERGTGLKVHDQAGWDAFADTSVIESGSAVSLPVPFVEHGDPKRDDDYYTRYHPEKAKRSKSATPYDKAVAAAILAVRERKDTERAIVVDPDGKVVLDKVGERSSVDFTDGEAASFANATLVHNHPQGLSLSGTDMSFAARMDMRAMIAVGTDATGKGWFYRLERPDLGWPVPLGMANSAVEARALAAIHADAMWRGTGYEAGYKRYQALMASDMAGDFSSWAERAAWAQSEAQHVNTATAAKALGAAYVRTPWAAA